MSMKVQFPSADRAAPAAADGARAGLMTITTIITTTTRARGGGG